MSQQPDGKRKVPSHKTMIIEELPTHLVSVIRVSPPPRLSSWQLPSGRSWSQERLVWLSTCVAWVLWSVTHVWESLEETRVGINVLRDMGFLPMRPLQDHLPRCHDLG